MNKETALVPYVDWFSFCPMCGHFKEIDTESTLEAQAVMCFSCADAFWLEYLEALRRLG